MRRALFATFALLFLLIPAFASAAQKQEDHDNQAAQLLKHAAQAVRKDTYSGVIMYLRGGEVDTLKVLHRYHDGKQEERLVSLSGPAREVIRKGNKVTSILPDQKLVLVSERPRNSLLGNISHFSVQKLEANYRVIDKGKARTAGRDSRVVEIRPRDEYRYGYRMVIDSKKYLPLQLELLKGDQQLEQMMFSAIAFPDSLPDSDFIPSYNVSGFRIVQHQAVRISKDQADGSEMGWHADELPSGFSLAESGVRKVSPNVTLRQFLYTDGVATVSVFIAPAGLRAPLKGLTSMGAVHAYGRIVDHTQITVVGEVPSITAKTIAEHMVKGTGGSKASGG